MQPFHFHTSVVLYSPARVKIVAYACEGEKQRKGDFIISRSRTQNAFIAFITSSSHV